jgi:DNA-binding NarL/FixJ family response regulator
MDTQAHTRKSVFIVEDSASLRSRLVKLLNELDGVRVVGEAETPSSAVEGILATHPGYVVLDYQLLGGTGVEVLQGVRKQSPDTVFIMLTNHPQPQYRRLCMEAGAHYFFDKSVEFGRVKDVIASHPSPV